MGQFEMKYLANRHLAVPEDSSVIGERPLSGSETMELSERRFDALQYAVVFENGTVFKNVPFRDKGRAGVVLVRCDGRSSSSDANGELVARAAVLQGMKPEDFFDTTTALLETPTTQSLLISRCCFAEDEKKFTKISNARTQPLFCSLNLLFSEIIFECFSNQLSSLIVNHWIFTNGYSPKSRHSVEIWTTIPQAVLPRDTMTSCCLVRLQPEKFTVITDVLFFIALQRTAKQVRSLSLRGIPSKIRDNSLLALSELLHLQTLYVTSLLRIGGAFFLNACKRCSVTSDCVQDWHPIRMADPIGIAINGEFI
ncbi:hypothetical protein pdam_00012532 [Pocillopora damicornis]|uniref:Uncharacterized protein n=1 Tax=Pocillopora damicornis TaxID=46731 RepID=A0A3M6UYJ1_POCDA|nr:hypothetical protein pdam_00012532 [Pocillopora damicornis]